MVLLPLDEMLVLRRVTPALNSLVPFIHLGGERLCESKVSGPRTGNDHHKSASCARGKSRNIRLMSGDMYLLIRILLIAGDVGVPVTDAAFWWSRPEWLLLQCVAAKPCDYNQ